MKESPALRCYMNLMALQSLPAHSVGFRSSFREQLALVAQAGYTGLQFTDPPLPDQITECRRHNLSFCASGRINTPAEAHSLAQRCAAEGSHCVTVHAGWGTEDDAAASSLIEAILHASSVAKLPLYIETHRATICQDMWRTVHFVSRFPEMRFNGDFSHWYAGQEMVYGGFTNKLAFIQPVLDRVRFLHGRIASPGCIQVPVVEGTIYVEHFRQLWTACFRAFLASGEQPFITFATELLGPEIFYARTFQGREESDRWQEMTTLKGMAEACFTRAQSC